MCFSAEASFGLSAVLFAGSIVSLKKVNNLNQIPFASIPLIFSLQQFCEGFVWLSLTNQAMNHLHTPVTILFLIFAQVLWPAWVPLAFWFIEAQPGRKKILGLIALSGLMVAAFLAYCLFGYRVGSTISNHHIKYGLDFAQISGIYTGIFYFISTVIPPFISNHRKMIFLGLLNLASFLVSKLFFEDNLVSVWCFFAAAISLMILFIMADFRRNKGPEQNAV